MNYAVVAFVVIVIISTIQWFVDGRHSYTGPYFDESAFIIAADFEEANTVPNKDFADEEQADKAQTED